MSSLLVMRPGPIVQGTNNGAMRLATPDPKEAVIIPNNSVGVTYDFYFGEIVTFDTFYIGYHYGAAASGSALVQEVNGIGGQAGVNYTPNIPLAPLGLGRPFHTIYRMPAPVSAAYLRLIINGGSQGEFPVGVFAYGLSMQPQYGHEWGGGRTIEDTGTAERLFGGGFGIDDGTVATGYQWTFGDLQPLEIRQLYQLVRDRRTTRSVLVVEDPDQTDGLNERIHWGLFRKLDAYERLDPMNTKWSLQIADWA